MQDNNIKKWKKNYTIVLVMNGLYILVFYFIMKYFS